MLELAPLGCSLQRLRGLFDLNSSVHLQVEKTALVSHWEHVGSAIFPFFKSRLCTLKYTESHSKTTHNKERHRISHPGYKLLPSQQATHYYDLAMAM